MHETRLACDLADIVTGVARREKLTKVTRINLKFGEMIQVVPDIFRFAFDEAIGGSVAEHAEVDIEIIPVSIKCSKCSKEFIIHDLVFQCRYCNSFELEIVHGKEMFVNSIEGE